MPYKIAILVFDLAQSSAIR